MHIYDESVHISCLLACWTTAAQVVPHTGSHSMCTASSYTHLWRFCHILSFGQCNGAVTPHYNLITDSIIFPPLVLFFTAKCMKLTVDLVLIVDLKIRSDFQCLSQMVWLTACEIDHEANKNQIVDVVFSGGAYIPPARLRMMQEQIKDKSSLQYQRMSWEALKKSINGVINKVNVSNIINIIHELFQENIVRGRWGQAHA